MSEFSEYVPPQVKHGLLRRVRGWFNPKNSYSTPGATAGETSAPIFPRDTVTDQVRSEGARESMIRTEGQPAVDELTSQPEESSNTKKSYQKRLAEVELVARGNPYLNQTVHDRIGYWESAPRPKSFLILAEKLGLSVEETEDLLQQRLEELIQQCQFFRATEMGVFLNHILGGDKRYKSQFETRTSGGILFPELRSEAEHTQFGFPQDNTMEGEVLREYRPIYGYFSPDENGIINRAGKHPPPNCVGMYGGVTVKIRRDVAMQRATMSFCDSLHLDNVPLCPVKLPHFSSLFAFSLFDQGAHLYAIQKFLEDPTSVTNFYRLLDDYTEVQFHGGLSAADIDSVHLSKGNGLTQIEIDRVIAAVDEFNQETGGNIEVVIY